VPYNVIRSGSRAKNMMRILERARLNFNVAVFREDCLANGNVHLQYGAAYEQTAPMPDTLPIKTRVYRLVNRRYQAAHLWPMSVSGRIDRISESVLPAAPSEPRSPSGGFRRLGHPEIAKDSSMRGRGFRSFGPVPATPFDDPSALLGMDVPASQPPILAVLLGLKQLENIASKEPFNLYLARHAWEHRTTFLNITG